MKKDLFVVISRDKRENQYIVELYSYNHHTSKEIDAVDMIKLFDSAKDFKFQVDFDRCRENAIIVAMEVEQNQSTPPEVLMFWINSKKFDLNKLS